jgi:hypothetical protein
LLNAPRLTFAVFVWKNVQVIDKLSKVCAFQGLGKTTGYHIRRIAMSYIQSLFIIGFFN